MTNRVSRAMATRDGVRAQHRAAQAPQPLPALPPLTEKAWMAQVVQLAGYRRWKIYHTHDSTHSAAGFPDLVLVRPPRLVFAELKTDRKSSQLTADQVEWLEALTACQKQGVQTFVWRPSDFDDMREVLW